MNRIGNASVIYVDTNIWIFYIEGNPAFAAKVSALMAQIDKSGARMVTNELTIAECLYKPAKVGNKQSFDAYESLFASGEMEIVKLNGSLAKAAALKGAVIGLKLVDAIHYVSALESGCDILVTSDSRFKSGPQLRVIQLVP